MNEEKIRRRNRSKLTKKRSFLSSYLFVYPISSIPVPLSYPLSYLNLHVLSFIINFYHIVSISPNLSTCLILSIYLIYLSYLFISFYLYLRYIGYSGFLYTWLWFWYDILLNPILSFSCLLLSLMVDPSSSSLFIFRIRRGSCSIIEGKISK